MRQFGAPASVMLDSAPGQPGNYVLQAAPVLFSQFPLGFGPVKLVNVVAGNNQVIVMSPPVLTNGQVLLNFTVNNVTNATYQWLQTAQLVNPAWTTNTAAILTTNVPNSPSRLR
jgi:hypothetical protein